MVRAICVALATLCWSANAISDDRGRDGNWWGTQSDLQRVSYIGGFWDGANFESEMASSLLFLSAQDLSGEAQINRIRESARVAEYLKARDHELFSGVTIGQMLDGINSFYSDYRNRRIYVIHAILIVANEISGRSTDAIERMTQFHREHDVEKLE